MEEILREEYLTFSGQKASPDFDAIVSRHSDAIGVNGIPVVLAAMQESHDANTMRRCRLLLDWLVTNAVNNEVTPLWEERCRKEAVAVIRIPNRSDVPYPRATAEIANQSDARERSAMDEARSVLVETEIAPVGQAYFERERGFVNELRLATGYIGTWQLLRGISVSDLRADAEAFLRSTDALWSSLLPEFVRERLDVDPNTATAADALALFRARDFDAWFPSRDLTRSAHEAMAIMGLDPTAGGRVVVDTADRPGKSSRAFCVPVRVPGEVYLVTLPSGGHKDWTVYFHEMAHALHYAHIHEEYPVEYRRFGDRSVTETFASLFEHLFHDERWLVRFTSIGAHAHEYARFAAFEELHFVRKYCSKLLFEFALYGGDASWEELPARYAALMSQGTGFRYRAVDAFLDTYPGFDSISYIRARQLQPLLAAQLGERFGTEWWTNPQSGSWLKSELFAHGSLHSADELAQRIAGSSLSFSPLVQSLEARLS